MSDEDVEKENGNAAFRREDYASALKHYNKAIQNAGRGADAALFSNKAAALLKLAKYSACIQECLAGLAAPGLTPELKSKIYCRMATAYEAQENAGKAMEALKNCEFTPSLLKNYSDLLEKLWVRNPEAMRAFCSTWMQQALSCGADTTALSLLMERMSMGYIPKQSKAKLIADHNKTIASYKKLLQEQHGGRPVKLSMVNRAGSGHVCTALLSDLKPISIGELRLDEVNVDKLLICRTIAEPVPALSTLIEDPAGAVTRLVLYNWCSPDEDLRSALPIGTCLAIKEPWCKTVVADGKPAVRVDNRDDVIYLEQTHSLLKKVKWRTTAPEASSSEKTACPDSWEKCQQRGNRFFVSGNYELAIAAYTDAIELKRTVAPKEVADLLANRAAAYLADERPTDAFWDCQSALFVQPGHLKATIRLAKAHASLGKYDEAKEILGKSPLTTRLEFQAEISKMNRLLREQQCADYDFKSMLKEAAASKTPRLDHADYNGGVEVQWISKEKGSGLVALRDFASGDLLFVNKAFEVAYKSDCKITGDCVNVEAATTSDPTRNVCLSRVIRRISNNKDLVQELYRLCADANFDRRKDVDDGETQAVDSARVAAIVSFNAIGSGDVNYEFSSKGDQSSVEVPGSGFTFWGSGLWLLASSMNHSCVPNTIIFFVGDLMFARAGKRVAKGEELTRSYAASAHDTYEQRQELFGRSFGFKCECELCVSDLKRAEEQPHLERKREVVMESLKPAMLDCCRLEDPKSLGKLVEDTRLRAEKFSNRLAYKNRYDLEHQIIYKSLGMGYNGLDQNLKAAQAFEFAYTAIVGNGTQTSNTFSFNSLTRTVIILCYHAASSYLTDQDFERAKEWVRKMQGAAKIAWGSDDKDLLAILYPGLPIEDLFDYLNLADSF